MWINVAKELTTAGHIVLLSGLESEKLDLLTSCVDISMEEEALQVAKAISDYG